MKTLTSLALALTLALGPVALASAQDGGVAAQPRGHGGGECDHGGRGHRGGPGGGHGRGPGGMHGDPAAHAEHRLRMMTAMFDLDARQQALVREILTQTSAEAQALHQQPRSEEGRAAMQALHQRTEQRIDAVLNPTQRATAARMRAVREQDMQVRRARHGEGRPEGRGAGR